jgi:hypothetical protein
MGTNAANPKSYKYGIERESNASINDSNEEEKGRKTNVINMAITRLWVIDEPPVTHIIATLQMGRK